MKKGILSALLIFLAPVIGLASDDYILHLQTDLTTGGEHIINVEISNGLVVGGNTKIISGFVSRTDQKIITGGHFNGQNLTFIEYYFEQGFPSYWSTSVFLINDNQATHVISVNMQGDKYEQEVLYTLSQQASNSLGQVGTVSENLDITIPSINYINSTETKNIWVNLKFSHQENDELYWRLDNYGVNQ
jgi:hypothetical protein